LLYLFALIIVCCIVFILIHRRLMIWKGVHPVIAKKESKKNVYYYKKDINYLARDGIMSWFRNRASHLKKIKNSKGRRDKEDLARRIKSAPKMKLDHIVKERYPTFEEALRGLDDALSLIAVYAKMMVAEESTLPQKTLDDAQNVYGDFLAYIVHARCLRKVFVSIKGIYYEAMINGIRINWITPMQAYSATPPSVDLQMMDDFLIFYVALLKFVNYRLYTDQGLEYPPKRTQATGTDDDAISRVKIQRKFVNPSAQRKREKEEEKAAQTKKAQTEKRSKKEKHKRQQKEKAEEIAKYELPDSLKESLEKKIFDLMLKEGISVEADAPENHTLQDELVPDEFEEEGAVKKQETKEGEKDESQENKKGQKDEEKEGDEEEPKKKKFRDVSRLFEGLKFYLNRETFLHSLDFVIRSCGGDVSWDGLPYKEEDPTITHQVVDKDVDRSTWVPGREYVQPQWVYDSVNNAILLPVQEYSADVRALPPHLSPFVNNRRRKYIPEQQEHLDELISREKHRWDEGKQVVEEEPDIVDSDDEIPEDDDVDIEAKYSSDLAKEQAGKRYSEELEEKRQKREQSKISAGLEGLLEKEENKKKKQKVTPQKPSFKEQRKKFENTEKMADSDSKKLNVALMSGRDRRDYKHQKIKKDKKERNLQGLLNRRKEIDLEKQKRAAKQTKNTRDKQKQFAKKFTEKLTGKK